MYANGNLKLIASIFKNPTELEDWLLHNPLLTIRLSSPEYALYLILELDLKSQHSRLENRYESTKQVKVSWNGSSLLRRN